MLVVILAIWLLVAALLAGLVAVCLSRRSADARLTAERAAVRAALAALAQPSRGAARPDTSWWVAHSEALEHELTPALAENPSVRSGLEAVAAAALPEVLALAFADPSAATADGAKRQQRLLQAGRLVCLAPPRAARRALLAMQAGDHRTLSLLASAALARHAATFADASSALACLVDLQPDPARAMGARWALARILAADSRRAPVHARDEAVLVRTAVLTAVDSSRARGGDPRAADLVAAALAHTADDDAGVRAAAFGALSRTSGSLPLAPIERGLEDADAAVRTAAASALPLTGADGVRLLGAVDADDPGSARAVRRAVRAQRRAPAGASHAEESSRLAFLERAAALGAADAESAAVGALSDPDSAVRRAAARALASIARLGASPRLQPTTVSALLTQLESESAPAVSAALVEALEATDDERAPTALTALALRAGPAWRQRLREAAALARRLRPGVAPKTPHSQARSVR